MKQTVDFSVRNKEDIITLVGRYPLFFAKSVFVIVYTDKKSALSEVRMLDLVVHGKSLPVSYKFVQDEDEKVGTVTISVDYSNVSTLIPNGHHLYSKILSQADEIVTFGSVKELDDGLMLTLILNSDDGFEMYYSDLFDESDLVFNVVETS